MKNKLATLLILPALLGACTGNSFAGKYSFMLGKQDGSHMYAVLDMKDEVQTGKDENDQIVEKGKKYTLEMSMDFNSGLSDLADVDFDELDGDSSGDGGEGQQGRTYFVDEAPIETEGEEEGEVIEDSYKVKGYYRIGEARRDGSHELLLGIVTDIEELSVIDDKIVELIIYATISKKEFNIAIPVSIVDLLLQLYWYGYDIDFENFEFKDSPHGLHSKGSHPTADDIKKINDDGFLEKHIIPYSITTLTGISSFSFRDYNVVHIVLARD